MSAPRPAAAQTQRQRLAGPESAAGEAGGFKCVCLSLGFMHIKDLIKITKYCFNPIFNRSTHCSLALGPLGTVSQRGSG